MNAVAQDPSVLDNGLFISVLLLIGVPVAVFVLGFLTGICRALVLALIDAFRDRREQRAAAKRRHPAMRGLVQAHVAHSAADAAPLAVRDLDFLAHGMAAHVDAQLAHIDVHALRDLYVPHQHDEWCGRNGHGGAE